MEDNNLENAPEDATRTSRLWASLIDSIPILILVFPLGYFVGLFDNLKSGSPPAKATFIVAIATLAIYFSVNFKFLRENAQTIGKKLLGIKIINLDGSKPSLKVLLIKRYIPYFGFGYIPYLGKFLNIVNLAFIFGAQKRCVHDRIAGTRVVKG